MPQNATYVTHHSHDRTNGPGMSEDILQKMQASSSRRRRQQYTPSFASRTPATDGNYGYACIYASLI